MQIQQTHQAYSHKKTRNAREWKTKEDTGKVDSEWNFNLPLRFIRMGNEPASMHKKHQQHQIKRKVSTQSKEDKLSDIIVDFNLAVNELYQLKEYKSIISWDPIENSSANDRH